MNGSLASMPISISFCYEQAHQRIILNELLLGIVSIRCVFTVGLIQSMFLGYMGPLYTLYTDINVTIRPLRP